MSFREDMKTSKEKAWRKVAFDEVTDEVDVETMTKAREYTRVLMTKQASKSPCHTRLYRKAWAGDLKTFLLSCEGELKLFTEGHGSRRGLRKLNHCTRLHQVKCEDFNKTNAQTKKCPLTSMDHFQMSVDIDGPFSNVR
ncbi:hypothetical protein STEG23_025386 [Scotinomys teguina]